MWAFLSIAGQIVLVILKWAQDAANKPKSAAEALHEKARDWQRERAEEAATVLGGSSDAQSRLAIYRARCAHLLFRSIELRAAKTSGGADGGKGMAAERVELLGERQDVRVQPTREPAD